VATILQTSWTLVHCLYYLYTVKYKVFANCSRAARKTSEENCCAPHKGSERSPDFFTSNELPGAGLTGSSGASYVILYNAAEPYCWERGLLQ